MPQVTIEIGGRSFDVACQDGEEAFLEAAANMLDNEARALTAQAGRLPESRMLLMAGLMLADRTAAVEDKVRELEAELASARARIDELESRPAPEPREVEVPRVPASLLDGMAELAARAEAVAEELEARTEGGAPEPAPA